MVTHISETALTISGESMAIVCYRVKWYGDDNKAHYSQPSNLTDTRRKACTHIRQYPSSKKLAVIQAGMITSHMKSPIWKDYGVVFRQMELRIYKADDEKQSYIIDPKTGKTIRKWL